MSSRLDACLECGKEFERAAGREFCATACRKRWNNRRMMRGAEIYDLYMALRFERGLAKVLGVFQVINRLASTFRHEDKEQRAGRRSWRPPQTVVEERPYLKAITTYSRIGRMGRG